MSRIIPINPYAHVTEPFITLSVAVIQHLRYFECRAQVGDGVCCSAVNAGAVEFGAHVVGGVKRLFVECLMDEFCGMLFWVYVFG
jgi:hypothetical protein